MSDSFAAPDFNPYAAPKAALEVVHDESVSIWRSGKILVCRRDAVFPARCLKCNAPAELPLARYRFAWHHGLWYLLIFLYVVIYLVVGLLVRRRATLEVGLCAKHKGRRLWGAIISWGGFAAIMAMVVLVVKWRVDDLMPYLFISFPAWIIASMFVPPRFTPARIDKERVRLRGCGRAFLDTLPPYAE